MLKDKNNSWKSSSPLGEVRRGENQYWIFFSILVLLTLFMILCNGPSSAYSGFDFLFHYRRFDVLIDALRHGSYPVYIDYSNVEGYGYFTKGFYPDLTLVPFALIGVFTDTYFAYDFMIFTMTILCGVFTYHAVRVIFKDPYAAAVSAILYTFALYRLLDFYQRGATAEAMSFTFLPLVFLGLHYVIKGDYRKWYVLTIGYSLLIYTHVIASVLMFITLLILLAVNYRSLIKEPKRIGYLFLAGVVTLIMVSYYVLPVIEQLNSNSFYLNARTPGGGAGYNKSSLDLILKGFLSGIYYPADRLWTGSGILLTGLLFLRFFIKKEDKSDPLKIADIGVIIGVCFIIAISSIFPWGRFPFSLLSFIQYPWRLFEFVVYFFAIAGGFYISVLVKKDRQRLYTFIGIIIVTLILIYVHSENFKHHYPEKDRTFYLTTEEPMYFNRYHTIGGEYFPYKIPNIEYIHERRLIAEVKNEDTKVANLRRDYNATLLDIEVNAPDTVALPLIWYLGYNVTLNGEKVDFMENNKGLIAVPVNRSGEIKAWYAGTALQKISFYITLISLLLLTVYIFLQKRKQKSGYAGNE